MKKENIDSKTLELYSLSSGKPVTSLTKYDSPAEEYCAAFEYRMQPFLITYTFINNNIHKRSFTRGDFWDLALIAADFLRTYDILKGDKVVHAFSCNSLYDLVFRMGSVFTGSVPVTVNWQTDDTEKILYKIEITKAKLIVYDKGFSDIIKQILSNKPDLKTLKASIIEESHYTNSVKFTNLNWKDERFIIFTSGTTGRPKGVSLSHRSYFTNKLTFESYFGISKNSQLGLLLVNPLHHTNSTALSDWAIRRNGAKIHLVEQYSTLFWKILVNAVSEKRDLFVTSLVSRHIDFLDSLIKQNKLPVKEKKLKRALKQTDILIGSAPVGPKTIKCIQKFTGRAPHVRFGSTETCLQVAAIPTYLSDNKVMKAFQSGLNHHYKGEKITGYYIGREHYPFTRLKVVRSLDSDDPNYMKPCETGEPGYLITQGGNIMTEYVGDKKATENVFKKGWYTGLRDIVFTSKNNEGQLDYYWVSRDSELLIRGGTNYAYAQIEEELSKIIIEKFHLKPEEFQLAVVGLRLESEHEDSCCVTIELRREGIEKKSRLESQFLEKANELCSKGAKPDLVRFAVIPRNFKGAVLYPHLKKEVIEQVRTKR